MGVLNEERSNRRKERLLREKQDREILDLQIQQIQRLENSLYEDGLFVSGQYELTTHGPKLVLRRRASGDSIEVISISQNEYSKIYKLRITEEDQGEVGFSDVATALFRFLGVPDEF